MVPTLGCPISDVRGISFSSTALHYLYYSSKFVRRGFLLYNLFYHGFAPAAASAAATASPWQPLRSCLAHLQAAPEDPEASLDVVSVGGKRGGGTCRGVRGMGVREIALTTCSVADQLGLVL
jgi:hypothetical protein